MKCPNCKETNLAISERKGIEIDYCPECRGIWLDRGELDKILDRSKAEEASLPARESEHRPAQRYDDHRGKPYKRRKSFFEELFD